MVKHTQTIRRQEPTNCLSMSDHFVCGWHLKSQNHKKFKSHAVISHNRVIQQCIIIIKKYKEELQNRTEKKNFKGVAQRKRVGIPPGHRT